VRAARLHHRRLRLDRRRGRHLHQLGADGGLDQRTLNALISYKDAASVDPYARQTFTLAQQLEAANVTSTARWCKRHPGRCSRGS